jgi:heme-degrading monooxygenase HmoA
VIRSVLRLRAAAGRGGALEEFYERHGVLARARKFDGCRGAVLLRATDDGPVTHLVIADWDEAADYRRWVDDPWRAALSRELAQLLDTTPGEPVVGGLFEFVPEMSPHPFVHPSRSEEQL